MLKTILAFSLVLSTSLLFSQQFYTSKTPFFKAKKSSIFVMDKLGDEIIKMPMHYRKNPNAKGRLKIILVDGKEYFITKHKGLEKVITSDQELVATIMCKKKKFFIHLLNENELYQENKKGWFTKKAEYVNTETNDIVTINGKNRSYEIGFNNEDKDTNKLLLALCLHRHLERIQQKQADDDAALFFDSLISQN